MFVVAGAMAIGSIACSEEPQVPDTPDAPAANEPVYIYGYIEPIVTPDASAIATRADSQTTYSEYENSKSSFDTGDMVGLYTQGGDMNTTTEGGASGPYKNEPMTYGNTSTGSGTTALSSFTSNTMNADISGFGAKFVYWPYTPDMGNAGMEVRDERGFVKDVLFSFRSSTEGRLSFTMRHAFTLLSITRGEGFDNPRFDESKLTGNAKKAYDYAKRHYDRAYTYARDEYAEDGWKFYMQVKLSIPIKCMQFPENESLPSTPDEYQGLTPLNYTVSETDTENDWSVFDGFKKNADNSIDGKTYPCFTVMVPASYSEFFYDYSSHSPYYRERVQIASISLFDNDGEWVTISDINLPHYKDDKFDGRLIRAGIRYPLTIAYNGLKPTVFPATVSPWNEEEGWTTTRPAGVSQDNFDKFIEAYNKWSGTGRPIQDETKYKNICTDLEQYANITKIVDAINGRLQGVNVTIFLSGDIDLSEHNLSGNSHFIEKLYENDAINGGGYTISNGYLTGGGSNGGIGFIGELNGTVSRLNLSGFTITAPTVTGASGVFCQKLGETGKIQNCRATNVSVATKGPVGAVAGQYAPGATITDCTVTGYLEGTKNKDKATGEDSGNLISSGNNFNGVYFQSVN